MMSQAHGSSKALTAQVCLQESSGGQVFCSSVFKSGRNADDVDPFIGISCGSIDLMKKQRGFIQRRRHFLRSSYV